VEQDSMKAVLIEEAPQKRSFLPFLRGGKWCWACSSASGSGMDSALG
jgi:hypothetical protein